MPISNEPIGARLGRAFQRSPEDQEVLDAYRLQIPVDELRALRARGVDPARPSSRVSPPQFPPNAFAEANSRDLAARPNYYVGPGEDTEEAAAMNRVQSARGRGAPRMGPGEDSPEAVAQADIRRARAGIMQNADMQNADVPGNIPSPGSVNEIRQAIERNQASRDRQRNRPNTRMTATPSPADALNQRELDRIASARGILEGGDIQPPAERSFLERLGLRRTNETGEGRPSTGNFREDLRQLGKSLGFKKGGKVKKMAKGGAVKAPSASRRGDGCASRGKTKGRMV